MRRSQVLRTMLSDQDHLTDAVANPGWLKNMLYHGYAVVVVERRGTGAPWGAVLAASEYPNMRDSDEKALTYTTLPLETDVELTGSSSRCRQSAALEPKSTREMISLGTLAVAALQEEG